MGLKCTHRLLFPRRNRASVAWRGTAWGQGQPRGCGDRHRQDKALQSTSRTRRAPGSWLLFPSHLGCWKRGKTREFISNTSPCSTGDLFRALELPGEAAWEVFMWCLANEGGKGGEGWQLWRARSAPAMGSLSHQQGKCLLGLLPMLRMLVGLAGAGSGAALGMVYPSWEWFISLYCP